MGKSSRKSRKRSRSRSGSHSSSSASSSSSSSRSRSRSPSRKKSKKSHKKSSRDKHKHVKREKHTNTSTSQTYAPPTQTQPTLTKEQIKAMETPEERNARRLAKKQKKAEKKQESSLYGYTDDSNPFGDANLTTAFVWKKKYEKILSSGGDPRQISKAAIADKQIELRKEIESVKERRKKREIEKEQMDEMREMMRREADKEAVEGWEEKEEEFHRKQAKTRTAIRITAGREKAIDILAKNLYLLDQKDGDDSVPVNWDVELTEPYRIFDGLLIYDLQELKKDLQQQVDLGIHLDYWNALLTVCDNEIHQQQGLAAGGVRLASIPASVARDVQGILGGKTVNQLESLECDIKQQITASQDGSGAVVDVAYWEAILKELSVYRAKAFLHEFHANLLKSRLQQLKQHAAATATDTTTQTTTKPADQEDNEDDYDKEFQNAAAGGDDSGSCSFSPVLHADDGDAAAELTVVDAEQDARELEAQRRMVLEQRQAEEKEKIQRDKAAGKTSTAMPASSATSSSQDPADAFARESAKPMSGDEMAFNNGEITLEESSYSWHDKYRPRKPRFFNRVKTGFEWNRYNSTHYDKENPPPKIVQGYKFNLFYPDLIEPTKAPTYRIDPDPENPDYCTIRFQAGAPYEDIAFKIVRKEWEYTPKRGFKCVFDKGVLHLYFNFKRYFYRR